MGSGVFTTAEYEETYSETCGVKTRFVDHLDHRLSSDALQQQPQLKQKGIKRRSITCATSFFTHTQICVSNSILCRISSRQFLRGEAHFWLNGYVNKQNCRIWSEANPQVYVETPLHPEKLTVWCALWAGGILLQKR
ncbi:hypothetical protein TNCV_751901 [Trichonephila clavipes]|uniref:Uncharacterized protein n=1 Tax=Trichonephila clavipes TaxID=2585209 RepID=A0A8X6WAX6_TRICX|nr:hypothetical protein TNCV_751901 [Trichonephila clavipes]